MKNIFNSLKKNSKKGFTLVEMIIVIVIIAILAAIAIPAMKGYIDDANESVAIANCRNALTASEATAPLTDSEKPETIEDFDAEIEKLLGTSCVMEEAVPNSGGAAGTYKCEGTFSEGDLSITFTVGVGTEQVIWSAEGNTATWNAGDSAPVVTDTP